MHQLIDTQIAINADLGIAAIHTLTELLYLQLGDHTLAFQIVLGPNNYDVLDRKFTIEVVLVDPVVQVVK